MNAANWASLSQGTIVKETQSDESIATTQADMALKNGARISVSLESSSFNCFLLCLRRAEW